MLKQIKKLTSLMMLAAVISCQPETKIQRETDFNSGWRFALDSLSDASVQNFDDSNWRVLDVPHDWSIEFAPDSAKEGCTAYFPGGIGWYRKHFNLAIGENQKAYLLFDGVYNNSEVFLNGQKLGEHPYGYSPFYFDLTDKLNPTGENVLAVKVDRSRYADSRWYSGSGIYRNVTLVLTGKLHIPVWGVFVTTPEVAEKEATVQLDVDIQNDFSEEKTVEIITTVFDASGKSVATAKKSEKVAPGSGKIKQKAKVLNPALWSTESPNLYTAEIQLREKGKLTDSYMTRFGIRSFQFDAENGFSLNGVNMKIKGVCLHHDGGLVGAAVPKGVWKRRLQILKDGGCNAIRSAHNPASSEFLDLCDEMGFLVQDEFFDEWDYPKDKRMNMWERHDDYISRGYAGQFQEWAESDLKSTMLSHRNHPSIIQWSIGNEIEWTYAGNREATGFFNNMNWSGNYFWSQPPHSPEQIKTVYQNFQHGEFQIGTTAQKLAGWTRQLDTTRPVIANCILPSASFQTGYADALDIVGFSYRRVMYDYAKEHFPQKIVMGTENLGQWHEWKAVAERPFVSGLFLWTGIDYLGEANNRWPAKGLSCGLIDAAGFEKPGYHMYKSLWNDEPNVYLCSNTAEKSRYRVNETGQVVEKKEGAWETALWEWYDVNEHWNYADNELVIAEVISNCAEVELFLNGTSLGAKKLADFPDRIYKWAVPFEPGKIEAVGKAAAGVVNTAVQTAGKPASVKINAVEGTIDPGGVAHVVAQIADENGTPVRHSEAEIEFSIEGDIQLLGVDNGDMKYSGTYKTNKIQTKNGRALLIVRAGKTRGTAKVVAASAGLTESAAEIRF